MKPDSYPDALPLAEVALARGETREITLRRVMRGELKGERRNGRWVVFPSAIPNETVTARPRTSGGRRSSDAA